MKDNDLRYMIAKEFDRYGQAVIGQSGRENLPRRVEAIMQLVLLDRINHQLDDLRIGINELDAQLLARTDELGAKLKQEEKDNDQ